MKAIIAKRVFIFIIIIFSMSLIVGCSHPEKAPNRQRYVMYLNCHFPCGHGDFNDDRLSSGAGGLPPLETAARLIPLITAIGASFFLQYTFRGLYGAGFQAYPVVRIMEGQIVFGEYRILRIHLVVIVAAALLLVALYSFIQRTRVGKAIRAVSEDKEASLMMGINIDKMISMTFVIGGMAAGAAGVLYALMFKQVHYFMGFIPGIKAFTALIKKGGELQDAIVDRGWEIAAKMGYHKEPDPMERVRIMNGALGLAREEIFETMLDFPADDDAPNDPASSEDEAADN